MFLAQIFLTSPVRISDCLTMGSTEGCSDIILLRYKSPQHLNTSCMIKRELYGGDIHSGVDFYLRRL